MGSLILASPARAELIRLTPTGLSAAGYEEAGYPTSPVIIGGEGFRLTYHGGGQTELVNPLMLIIGIPDTSPLPAATPSLSFSGVSQPTFNVAVDVGDTDPDATDGYVRYGGSWNTTTGYAGTFDASAGNMSVYELIGFTPRGSDSENFTNWSGATGLASWDLFVYSLSFSPDLMSRGDWAEFTTSLPTGSYVIGYGCSELDSAGLCKEQKGGGNNGDTESTPFTFAGRVAQVPEPSSIALLIPGLALALRRRRSRVTA